MFDDEQRGVLVDQRDLNPGRGDLRAPGSRCFICSQEERKARGGGEARDRRRGGGGACSGSRGK